MNNTEFNNGEIVAIEQLLGKPKLAFYVRSYMSGIGEVAVLILDHQVVHARYDRLRKAADKERMQ
jgi:hypothetical protein